MKVHIITPFPEMVNSIIECSILGKAHERGCVEYQIHKLVSHHRVNSDFYPSFE